MAGEQTREEVTARLEAIFSSAMEGEDLEKALISIEKRLDKFEGKWGGLIKWAEQKYGKPEDSERPVQEENEQEQQESEPPAQVELSREEAFSALESIFRSNIEGKELEKMIGSIEKRLDKFEGKWPKLILWAEGSDSCCSCSFSSWTGRSESSGFPYFCSAHLISPPHFPSNLSSLFSMLMRAFSRSSPSIADEKIASSLAVTSSLVCSPAIHSP
jgi:hypothetical protein